MPGNNENVTTKFKVDISDLKANISAANKQIQTINAQFKNATAGMDDWSKSADGLSAKIKQQSGIVEQEQKKLQALKQQLERLNQSQEKGKQIIADLTAKQRQAAAQYGENSDEAKAYAKQLLEAQKAQQRNADAAENLRLKIINQDTAVKNATAQVGKYETALNDLENEVDDVDDALENTASGGVNAFAVAMGNLAATAITKVVEGLANVVTGALEVGKQFEASMSNVQAVSGATAEEMQILEETARKYGSTTQFSASEAADALGYMALAGWDANQSADALGGVLNLAAASGMELAEASDMVTDYMSAFGMEADKSAYFADLLAYAQANANTTAAGLGEAFKNSAANMNAAGQDIETTVSLLAMMANQGLKGSEAGTALTAVMRDMTAKMTDGAIAIGDTSVKVMDANGNYRDLTDILKDVEAATNGMGDAEKAAALSTTFTADSIKGLNLMLNAGVDSAADFEEQLRNSGGSAEEMARIMNDNLEGDLKSLNSAYEELGITLYQSANAPLREIVQTVTNDVLPAFTELINGTEGAGEKVGTALGGLIDNVLTQITNLLPQAAEIGVALISSVVSGLLDSLPSIITSLVDMAVIIINKLAELLPQIVNKIVDVVPLIVDALTDAIPTLLDAAINFLTAIVNAIPVIVSSIADKLPHIIDSIVTAIVKGIPQLIQGAEKLFTALVDAIPKILPPLIAALPKIINAIIGGLASNTPMLFQAAVSLLTTIIQAIPQLVTQLVPQIVGIVQMIAGILVQNVPILLQAALQMLGALIEAIPTIYLELLKAVPQIIDAVLLGLANLPGILFEYWTGIWNGIKNIFAPVTQYFSDKFKSAWDGVKKIWDIVKTYFTEKWNAIKTVFSAVGSYFSKQFTDAWSNVKKAFSKVGEFFGGIWDTIKKTFASIGTKVGDAIGGAFKTAINAVIATVERGINMIPNAVNAALDLINALPGVNISKMPTVSLPRLARGGIVDKATLAEIGEDGTEAVIPLEKNKRGLKQIAQALAGEMQSGGTFGGSDNSGTGGTTVYNFNQTNNSPKALSRYEIYRQTKNMINAVKMQGV